MENNRHNSFIIILQTNIFICDNFCVFIWNNLVCNYYFCKWQLSQRFKYNLGNKQVKEFFAISKVCDADILKKAD